MVLCVMSLMFPIGTTITGPATTHTGMLPPPTGLTTTPTTPGNEKQLQLSIHYCKLFLFLACLGTFVWVSALLRSRLNRLKCKKKTWLRKRERRDIFSCPWEGLPISAHTTALATTLTDMLHLLGHTTPTIPGTLPKFHINLNYFKYFYETVLWTSSIHSKRNKIWELTKCMNSQLLQSATSSYLCFLFLL